MATAPITIDPFAKFPSTSYAAVTIRSQVTGRDKKETCVRVRAGHSPKSMINWSTCGEDLISARLITRREFLVAQYRACGFDCPDLRF